MISILIAEDDPDMQRHLASLIDAEAEFRLLGVTDHIAGITKTLTESKPDVLLLDLQLHQDNSLHHIAEFIALAPDTRICVLTMLNEEDSLIQALSAGAKGYLVKGHESELLVQEIKTLYLGGSPLSAGLAQKLVTRLAPEKNQPNPLTERQSDILRLIALGFQYKDIADELHISPQTVRTHIRNIYDILAVRSKREAIQKGKRFGIF